MESPVAVPKDSSVEAKVGTRWTGRKTLLLVSGFFAAMALFDSLFPVAEVQEQLMRTHPNNLRLLTAFAFESDSSSGSSYSRTYVLLPDSLPSGTLYVAYGADGPAGHREGIQTMPFGLWVGAVFVAFSFGLRKLWTAIRGGE